MQLFSAHVCAVSQSSQHIVLFMEVEITLMLPEPQQYNSHVRRVWLEQAGAGLSLDKYSLAQLPFISPGC